MRPASILTLVALLVLAAPATAEGQAPSHDPRKAHAETDTNGDGSVDRAEFHARMVEIFFFADADRDGYIAWAEIEQAVVLPDRFRDADTDGDGRVSLYEFERVNFYDFEEVDTNDDGLLSVDEVVVVYEVGGVK